MASRIKPMGKGVSRMTNSMAHIGVLAVAVGLLVTTGVGSGWSMEVLLDDQLAAVTGKWPPQQWCPQNTPCEDDPTCDHTNWTCRLDPDTGECYAGWRSAGKYSTGCIKCPYEEFECNDTGRIWCWFLWKNPVIGDSCDDPRNCQSLRDEDCLNKTCQDRP